MVGEGVAGAVHGGIKAGSQSGSRTPCRKLLTPLVHHSSRLKSQSVVLRRLLRHSCFSRSTTCTSPRRGTTTTTSARAPKS